MARTTEERLEWLETTLALQDRTIEQLNEALIAQQRTMDRLENGVQALADKLRAYDTPLEEGEADEPLPPHYQISGPK
ncbi:MAG: SlyX family protein [Desulfocurvibacter africanus]